MSHSVCDLELHVEMPPMNEWIWWGGNASVVYLMSNWSCTSKAVSFNPHLNCSIMMQNACWKCIINTVSCFLLPKCYFHVSTGKPWSFSNFMSQGGKKSVSSSVCFREVWWYLLKFLLMLPYSTWFLLDNPGQGVWLTNLRCWRRSLEDFSKHIQKTGAIILHKFHLTLESKKHLSLNIMIYFIAKAQT